MIPDDLPELLAAVARRDRSAAPALRRLSQDLAALADSLETQPAPDGGSRSPGGLGEVVSLAVVGPDGIIKQTAVTTPAAAQERPR